MHAVATVSPDQIAINTLKLSATILLGVILRLVMSMTHNGNLYIEDKLAINIIPRLLHDHIKVTFYIYLNKSQAIHNSDVNDQSKQDLPITWFIHITSFRQFINGSL